MKLTARCSFNSRLKSTSKSQMGISEWAHFMYLLKVNLIGLFWSVAWFILSPAEKLVPKGCCGESHNCLYKERSPELSKNFQTSLKQQPNKGVKRVVVLTGGIYVLYPLWIWVHLICAQVSSHFHMDPECQGRCHITCRFSFLPRNLEAPETPVYSVKGHKEIINSIDGVGGLGIGEGAPEIVTGSRDGELIVNSASLFGCSWESSLQALMAGCRLPSELVTKLL